MGIQLRIILLVVGLLILFGVAIDVLRRRPQKSEELEPLEQLDLDLERELEPELALDADTGLNFELDLELDEYIPPQRQPQPPAIDLQDIIVIYIMSRSSDGFNGGELYSALSNAHLFLEPDNIFYRFEQDNGTGDVLFRVVKAVEPGYFDPEIIYQEQIPGITVIMQLKKLTNPQLALDKLIRSIKQISFVLNGELLDHNRQALTLTTINSYKDKIAEPHI